MKVANFELYGDLEIGTKSDPYKYTLGYEDAVIDGIKYPVYNSDLPLVEVRLREDGTKFAVIMGGMREEIEKAHTEYCKFMCNPANIHNCDFCPENRDFSGRYPCGQQNCWVLAHCKGEEED